MVSLVLAISITFILKASLVTSKLRCNPKSFLLDPGCDDACFPNGQGELCRDLCNCVNDPLANDTCATLDFATNGSIQVEEIVPAGSPLFQLAVTGTETWTFSLSRTKAVDGSVWSSLKTYFEFKYRSNHFYEMLLNNQLDLEAIYKKLGVKLKVLEFILNCTTGDTKQTQMNQLLVKVIPVNEFRPRFVSQNLGNDIPENTEVGSKVFILKPQVIDEDVNPEGDELGPFRLWPYLPIPRLDGLEFFKFQDPQKGTIMLTKCLDYDVLSADNRSALYLNVSASDVHQEMTFTTLTLRVKDVDDLPPEFLGPSCPNRKDRPEPCLVSYTAKVPVGFQGEVTNISPSKVQARDMDSLRSPIVYSLEEAPGDTDGLLTYFDIDVITGKITLLIPFDGPTVFNITIIAREDSKDARRTQTTLTITVVPGLANEQTDPPGLEALSAGKSSDKDNDPSIYFILTVLLGAILLCIHIVLLVICWKLSSRNNRQVVPLAPSLCGSLVAVTPDHSPHGATFLVNTHNVVNDVNQDKVTQSKDGLSPLKLHSVIQEQQVFVGPGGIVTHTQRDIRSKSKTYPPGSPDLPKNIALRVGLKNTDTEQSRHSETGSQLHGFHNNQNFVGSKTFSPSVSTDASTSRLRTRSSPMIQSGAGTKGVEQSAIRDTSSTPDVRKPEHITPSTPKKPRRDGEPSNQRNNNRFGKSSEADLVQPGGDTRVRNERRDRPEFYANGSSSASNGTSMTDVSEEVADEEQVSQVGMLMQNVTTTQPTLPTGRDHQDVAPLLLLERLSLLSAEDAKLIMGGPTMDKSHANQARNTMINTLNKETTYLQGRIDQMNGNIDNLKVNPDLSLSRPYTGPGHRSPDQIKYASDLRPSTQPGFEHHVRKNIKRRKDDTGRSDVGKLYAPGSSLKANNNDVKAKERNRDWSTHHRSRDKQGDYFYRQTQSTNIVCGDFNNPYLGQVDGRPYTCETYERDQMSVRREPLQASPSGSNLQNLRILRPASSTHAQRQSRVHKRRLNSGRSRLQSQQERHQQIHEEEMSKGSMPVTYHNFVSEGLVSFQEATKRKDIQAHFEPKYECLPHPDEVHQYKQFETRQSVEPNVYNQQDQIQLVGGNCKRRTRRAASEQGVRAPKHTEDGRHIPSTAPDLDYTGSDRDHDQSREDVDTRLSDDVQNWINSTH